MEISKSRIFALRALLKTGEVVVLPQTFVTIIKAEEAAKKIVSKKKFIGDDKKLYPYSQIRKFQIINTRNLEIEKEF